MPERRLIPREIRSYENYSFKFTAKLAFTNKELQGRQTDQQTSCK